MYQVITIGSALVDIFIHSDSFKSKPSNEGQLLCQVYGDKMEVDSFKVYSGGGATNTAVGFSRLGLTTAIVCETGRDHCSGIVMNDLIEESVETSLVIKEKKEQTGGSIILVGDDGGRTVMVHRGASSMLDSFDIPTYWLSKTSWVHLTSIAGREKTLEKIFSLITREANIGLSWNPGKAELSLLAQRKLLVKNIPCRLFFVNKQEWEMLGSVQEEILKHISQVVVTEGSKGGDVYLAGERKFHFPAEQTQSVDDTGAGDAFACAYTAGQILGKLPQESAKWGVRNSTNVIKYFGAKPGLLRREQIVAHTGGLQS